MNYRIILVTACALALATARSPAQKPAPPPEIPPNALVTVANGVQLIFLPGPNPTLTARATSGEDLAPGLSVAINQTVRYVDKKGQSIDPKSITSSDRIQALY